MVQIQLVLVCTAPYCPRGIYLNPEDFNESVSRFESTESCLLLSSPHIDVANYAKHFKLKREYKNKVEEYKYSVDRGMSSQLPSGGVRQLTFKCKEHLERQNVIIMKTQYLI